MQNCHAIIVWESVMGLGGLRKILVIVISMFIVRVRETLTIVVVIPEYGEIGVLSIARLLNTLHHFISE